VNKLSRIALVAFSCAALTLNKPLPSFAFTSLDLDASNDALSSLAVPLKMLRFSSQDAPNSVADESLLDSTDSSPLPLATVSNLYVVSSLAVLSRYDSTTGTLLQTNGINEGPRALTIGGANQDVFVSRFSARTGTGIDRYDRAGNFLGVFATDQSGAALFNPGSLKFSPINGNLLVANAGNSSVAGFISQFDKDTGSFLGVFAANGGSFKPSGIAFGTDNNLYVSDNASKSILQFNGTSGALLGTFASGSNLVNPGDLAFGPSGSLFVGNTTGNLTGNILKFNGTTFDTFTSGTTLGPPGGFAFGPDNNLYVTDSLNLRVAEFDGTTGAFIKNFATNSSSNDLINPVGLVFGPAPVPEPAMGAGLPSLLLMGAYFRSKMWQIGKKNNK
jgi:hypothetical protein